MDMEEIVTTELFNAVIRAVTGISTDVKRLLEKAYQGETDGKGQNMIHSMLENLDVARMNDKAVCQSPGYPTTYLFYNDSFPVATVKPAVARALSEATKKGYLRPSIVDPLTRNNPGDNTGEGVPNIEYIYTPQQEYTDFFISFKGCGAELGNAMKIFTTATLDLSHDFAGLKKFVLETVIEAGGKPCPPYGIGIGIGGQMDIASKLSRQAISTRKWDDKNPDPLLARLEEELLSDINALGIGPAGIGGNTSCLAVKINKAATHTAIAPVAINFHCWVARRAGIRLFKDGTVESIL